MKKYENVELELIPAELIWTDTIIASTPQKDPDETETDWG